jgi:hypothetical protein
LRGRRRSLSAVLSFFFCVPKRRNKKRAPQPVLALRASLTSRRERDAEKLGLRPQTVPASFSAPVCEARQDKWGNSHWHAAEHRRGCRKGALHCLRREPSLQCPGSIEEYPMRGINSGYPAFGGTSAWVPFPWLVSLGRQRNEHTDFMVQPPKFSEEPKKKPETHARYARACLSAGLRSGFLQLLLGEILRLDAGEGGKPAFYKACDSATLDKASD